MCATVIINMYRCVDCIRGLVFFHASVRVRVTFMRQHVGDEVSAFRIKCLGTLPVVFSIASWVFDWRVKAAIAPDGPPQGVWSLIMLSIGLNALVVMCVIGFYYLWIQQFVPQVRDPTVVPGA